MAPPASAIASTLLAAALAGCGEPGAAPPGESRSPTIRMSEVSYEEYAGSRLSQRARIAELAVAPAAFGPFEVALVDELVVAGLRLELFVDGEGGTTGRVRGAVDDPWLGALRISRLRGEVPLGGARFVDPAWVVWSRGQVVARLAARQARVRHRAAPLEFLDARLELPGAGRIVSARRAVWEPRSGTFALRDGYVLEEPAGRVTGDRARIALDAGKGFEPVPARP